MDGQCDGGGEGGEDASMPVAIDLDLEPNPDSDIDDVVLSDAEVDIF